MEKVNKVADGYSHNTILYRLLKPLLVVVVKIVFNPKIIGKENILKNDGCVIACNHVHAFDPVMIIYSNKRIVRFLDKK